MDKKTKALFVVVAILFSIAAFWKFYLFFIKKDYSVFDHIPCDPYSEICFAIACGSDDIECEPEYYKKIEIKGYDYRECEKEGDCVQEKCFSGDFSCEVSLCTPSSELEDGEYCSSLVGENSPSDAVVTDSIESGVQIDEAE